MECYIVATGSHLPGEPVSNEDIPTYLGEFEHEAEVREKILRMNGIQTRHYALDNAQRETADLYDLAARAVRNCLQTGACETRDIGYLSAGTTNAPLVAPGMGTLLHARLAVEKRLAHPVEISSHAGICTASAQALVSAIRAVKSGEHARALAVGSEQPSAILKSSVMTPPEDRDAHSELRKTRWFMSIFLGSMLSDGAGAALLQKAPSEGLSFRVNWTFSRSFAHATPLCMQLESRTLLLTQNVETLASHLRPSIEAFLEEAIRVTGEPLDSYDVLLPHLSSFFFQPYMKMALKKFSGGKTLRCWTNLETAGNTGAASAYIMLDEYARTQQIEPGERILLFIPESGQFNFVLISLTAVHNADSPR